MEITNGQYRKHLRAKVQASLELALLPNAMLRQRLRIHIWRNCTEMIEEQSVLAKGVHGPPTSIIKACCLVTASVSAESRLESGKFYVVADTNKYNASVA